MKENAKKNVTGGHRISDRNNSEKSVPIRGKSEFNPTVCNNLDTVAYIPNAVMDSMQPLMERAFYEQDWAGCYDMFENGYKFIPVTGEEYRELVRQGLN